MPVHQPSRIAVPDQLGRWIRRGEEKTYEDPALGSSWRFESETPVRSVLTLYIYTYGCKLDGEDIGASPTCREHWRENVRALGREDDGLVYQLYRTPGRTKFRQCVACAPDGNPTVAQLFLSRGHFVKVRLTFHLSDDSDDSTDAVVELVQESAAAVGALTCAE
jgi:hypothetical protein